MRWFFEPRVALAHVRHRSPFFVLLQPYHMDVCQQVVVVDESHMLRTTNGATDAMHTEAVCAALQRSRRAVCLSGTPSLTRPFDLFRQARQSVLHEALVVCLLLQWYKDTHTACYTCKSMHRSTPSGPACSAAARTILPHATVPNAAYQCAAGVVVWFIQLTAAASSEAPNCTCCSNRYVDSAWLLGRTLTGAR